MQCFDVVAQLDQRTPALGCARAKIDKKGIGIDGIKSSPEPNSQPANKRDVLKVIYI